MPLVSRAASPSENGDRVAAARTRCESELRSLFAKAGVGWPAGEVFLRGIKREGQLEVWARDRKGDPFRLVKAYPVTAQSGGPGPKRREGDGQVPEGFYQVDRFNPRSAFHLSLGIDYPNASDRVLSDPKSPGFDIFIHGGKVSIGCLALGDPAIEQVYLIALESRTRPIHVHLFPARMDGADWPAWRDAQIVARPGLRSLWEQLAAGWSLFERDRRIPRCEVLPDGGYRCLSGR
jgi:murein L,D-transpeptidase YafK